jgi:hypothetical protein
MMGREMRRTSVLKPLAAGVTVLMALSLFACSRDDDDELSGPSSTTEAGAPGRTGSSTSSSGGDSTTTADEHDTTSTNRHAEPCNETGNWTMAPEQVDGGIADPIYSVDAGRHDAPQCYDQLSFRLNGAGEAGYYVGYADGSDVRVEGDNSVTVAGDAALIVDIAAPTQGGRFDRSGHAPSVVLASTLGQTLYPVSNPRGLKVIQEVRFAGELEASGESGSIASFAVGVDRQRPFAVSSFVDEDSNTRVIAIRIAH